MLLNLLSHSKSNRSIKLSDTSVIKESFEASGQGRSSHRHTFLDENGMEMEMSRNIQMQGVVLQKS